MAGQLMVVLVLLFAALPALAVDTDALRRKQRAQERARALAGELVDTILEIQIRQLEENGLTELPIYRDITSMRSSVHELMKDDMEAIVRLLVEAQEGTQERRLEKFNEARGQIREVVARLMAERQKLYRRMQVAKLSAEVRQLIALETKAHSTTRSLALRKQDERERMTLLVIEDQADVQKLYYQLLAALADVSTWGGQIGAGASDGLRILRAAQVQAELKKAADALGKAKFQDAASSQYAVIKGLAALLEQLEETQGLIDSDREEALKLVREMLRKQQLLRERAKQTELNERTAEPLIEQQAEIQRELGKLAQALSKYPTTEPLLEDAKAASFEATANLFEEKKPEALDRQNEVIGNLAQIEKVLEQGLDLVRSDKSADELAAEVHKLRQLKQQLEAAAAEQAQASKSAEHNAPQAAEHEQRVAKELAKSEMLGDLPSTIDAQLHSAKEAVAEACKQLADPAAEAAPVRKQAAENAAATIKQAQAEVEATMADTQRRQKAVEVGELARAAEALERAAAAERRIASETAEAAKNEGLDAVRAEALATEHKDVEAVAERITEGVKNTAPQAAESLARARPVIDEAGKQLDSAKQQPGEVSKPAAQKASEAAAQVEQQLTKAAAELRTAARRSAEELGRIASEQLARAEAARQAVENVAEAAPKSASEAIAQLQQARQKVGEAVTEQAKAGGRAAEAAAKALTERIAEAMRQQAQADEASAELARGKANNPLDAASQQQEVADIAAELAGESPQEVAGSLKAASRSAAEAAKETLGGNPLRAEEARNATRGALAEAMKAAEEMARQAAADPPGEPDAAAQAKAAENAGEAQHLAQAAAQMAGEPAEQAAHSLGQARQQAASAKEKIETGQGAEANESQQQASQALARAAEKIDEALQSLAGKQAERLAAEAQQAGQLVEQAAQVDPGAAAALAQARRAAQQGSQAATQPTRAAQAQQNVERNMERAAANLAAREQQLRRDRDLAEMLAELAKDQQAARDAIASAAEQLQQMSAAAQAQAGQPMGEGQRAEGQQAAGQAPMRPTPKQIAAAQTMQQAQMQFAQAQFATGQGAAQVSGQQQVANVPIREGLEFASRLNQTIPGAMPLEAQPGEGTPTEGQPGESQPAEGQPGEGQSGEGQPGQGQPGQGQPGQGQPSQTALGTGLVPSSPQATAQQIAGSQANAAAAATMAAAGQQPGQGQGQAPGQSPMEGDASSTASTGGAAKEGQPQDNQPPMEGDLQPSPAAQADSRGQLAGHDTAGGNLALEREPWFAKLPPALQAAIQAKARGKAPRGYEERLRRYFESVD